MTKQSLDESSLSFLWKDSLRIARICAKKRFDVELPDPPDDYQWTLDEPGLGCARLGNSTGGHRGWARLDGGPGVIVVIVRNTTFKKDVPRHSKTLQVKREVDTKQEAIIMLHTLICLGEPT